MSNGTTALRVSPVDLITALQEGENAKARVPELERENATLQRTATEAQEHNQALELKCRDYRDQIDQLQARVRSLVVERDDASFRELETADKLEKLVRAVANLRDLAGAEVDRANPPKADPAPATVSPPPVPTHGAPTASPTTSVGSTEGAYWDNSGQHHPGQSEPNPTAPVKQAEIGHSASLAGADTPTNASPNTTTEQSPSTADNRPWWEKEGAKRDW